MITFKIHFLLCFQLNTKSGTRKQSDKPLKAKKKSSQSEVDNPFIVYGPDNLLGSAKIEYELIPDKIKYEIELLCWGLVAKLISRDGQITLKTVRDKEKVWVPVCMEHYIDKLSLEEIKDFHRYIIDFKISTDKSKLAATTKITVHKSQLTDYSRFNEVVEIEDIEKDVVKQDSKANLKKFIQQDILMPCVNYPTSEIVSWLNFPENFDLFYDIIDKDNKGKDITCKDFVRPCESMNIEEKKVKLEETKSSKTKKEKVKSNTSKTTQVTKTKSMGMNIQVPAEIFFSDPNHALYVSKTPNNIIKNAFVILSANQLLTRVQKLLLNMLVIKIKKLNNLPLETLKNLGVETVYASYEIPFIARCKTIEKPVAEKILLNEAHVHFTDTVPRIKLIEFIQTQKLFVEIYGNRKISPPVPHYSLFGSEPDDDDISKTILTRMSNRVQEFKDANPILLAVASFDISSLVVNVWDFRESGQCHEPNLTLCRKSLPYYGKINYMDAKNICEVNLNTEYKERRGGPLLEEVLISKGTRLQVEVYLLAPQAASLILHQYPNTFKRIFLILNVEVIAKNLYIDIINHNNSVSDELKAKETPDMDIELSDLLTGFILDNGNSFALFVEGLSTGFILNIWHMFDSLDSKVGKIFFNTDIAFEKRLYSNFIHDGLYTITLKIPLHDILAKTKIYLRGYVPTPCLEALKKLSLIFISSSYQHILQQNLLPKPEELVSMGVEWGVCLRWKETVEKNVRKTVWQ